MIALLVLLLILSTEVIIGIFHPILIPQPMVTSITDYLSALWVFDGVLPITAFFKTLFLVVTIGIGKVMFNVAMAIIGMFSSANPPKLD